MTNSGSPTAIGAGQVLSASPGGPDAGWPHPAIRDLIEEVGIADLERGFEIGLFNRRGVTSRHPTEGGGQERRHAERYEGFAVAINDRWPRTAAILRRIADSYRVMGRREDQEAELREDRDR